jgi:hypothetical protein
MSNPRQHPRLYDEGTRRAVTELPLFWAIATLSLKIAATIPLE